jgi:hypothetical protein
MLLIDCLLRRPPCHHTLVCVCGAGHELHRRDAAGGVWQSLRRVQHHPANVSTGSCVAAQSALSPMSAATGVGITSHVARRTRDDRVAIPRERVRLLFNTRCVCTCSTT